MVEFQEDYYVALRRTINNATRDALRIRGLDWEFEVSLIPDHNQDPL
jgi:hypothetical protein